MINNLNMVNISSAANKTSRAENNSNKIAFGVRYGGGSSSLSASYSKRIHELKKELLFYKIFPFLNPEPKVIQRGNCEELVGEYTMRFCDKKELAKSLEAKMHKLYLKVNKR